MRSDLKNCHRTDCEDQQLAVPIWMGLYRPTLALHQFQRSTVSEASGIFCMGIAGWWPPLQKVSISVS